MTDDSGKKHWTKRPGLFWAKTGEVGCGAHTPYPGSDTWNWHGWKKMTAAHHDLFVANNAGEMLECETCGKTYDEAND